MLATTVIAIAKKHGENGDPNEECNCAEDCPANPDACICECDKHGPDGDPNARCNCNEKCPALDEACSCGCAQHGENGDPDADCNCKDDCPDKIPEAALPATDPKAAKDIKEIKALKNELDDLMAQYDMLLLQSKKDAKVRSDRPDTFY